jgi:hypothetical protein
MTSELSPRWLSAVDNVVGCALAFRAKAVLQGDDEADVDGELFIKDLVLRSAQIAKEAHSRVPSEECDCGQCEEISIIISASVQMAVVTGQPKEVIVDEALRTFHEYMKGRS